LGFIIRIFTASPKAINKFGNKYFLIIISIPKSTHHPTNKKPRYLAGLMLCKR
jgi:hypothetical protein